MQLLATPIGKKGTKRGRGAGVATPPTDPAEEGTGKRAKAGAAPTAVAGTGNADPQAFIQVLFCGCVFHPLVGRLTLRLRHSICNLCLHLQTMHKPVRIFASSIQHKPSFSGTILAFAGFAAVLLRVVAKTTYTV